MNGETGKVVGKPPISIPKVLLWFFGIAAGLVMYRLARPVEQESKDE